MRKFLRVAAIVVLALLVAAPAMALDFKFGAEYRIRFYSNLNGAQATLGDDNLPNNNARGIQSRIRPRFDVSDDNGNMTATLRLEIGDIEWGNGGGAAGTANGGSNGSINYSGARVGNGAGGGMGVDGVNVETKWAYVDFANPWGVPLRWRAGLQPWYEAKGIIIDDDVTGVRAYGNAGIFSYEAGYYRPSGGPCTAPPAGAAGACSTTNTSDNNLEYLEAKVGAKFAKWLNPSLYYILGRNAATNTTVLASTYDQTKAVTQNLLGLSVTGDANILTYDLDFAAGYQTGGLQGNYNAAGGPGDGRVRVGGWMVDAGIHVPIGPVLLHFVGSYATGDKQDGGMSEAMPWISPSWNGAGGLYEIIGSGGVFDQVGTSQDYPAGLWMLGAGVEYRPVKALWMRLMYGFAGFTTSRANCGYTNSKVNGACYGPVYQGKGFVAPTTAAGAPAGTGTFVSNGGVGGLGQEISLRADYDLWTNFKIMGAAGWMIPSEGALVSEYVLQLLYNF